MLVFVRWTWCKREKAWTIVTDTIRQSTPQATQRHQEAMAYIQHEAPNKENTREPGINTTWTKTPHKTSHQPISLFSQVPPHLPIPSSQSQTPYLTPSRAPFGFPQPVASAGQGQCLLVPQPVFCPSSSSSSSVPRLFSKTPVFDRTLSTPSRHREDPSQRGPGTSGTSRSFNESISGRNVSETVSHCPPVPFTPSRYRPYHETQKTQYQTYIPDRNTQDFGEGQEEQQNEREETEQNQGPQHHSFVSLPYSSQRPSEPSRHFIEPSVSQAWSRPASYQGPGPQNFPSSSSVKTPSTSMFSASLSSFRPVPSNPFSTFEGVPFGMSAVRPSSSPSAGVRSTRRSERVETFSSSPSRSSSSSSSSFSSSSLHPQMRMAPSPSRPYCGLERNEITRSERSTRENKRETEKEKIDLEDIPLNRWMASVADKMTPSRTNRCLLVPSPSPSKNSFRPGPSSSTKKTMSQRPKTTQNQQSPSSLSSSLPTRLVQTPSRVQVVTPSRYNQRPVRGPGDEQERKERERAFRVLDEDSKEKSFLSSATSLHSSSRFSSRSSDPYDPHSFTRTPSRPF